MSRHSDSCACTRPSRLEFGRKLRRRDLAYAGLHTIGQEVVGAGVEVEVTLDVEKT